MAGVVPTEQNIFLALGTFLEGVLPAGVEVRQGQINRVSSPSDTDYAVMWPLRRQRLATNLSTYEDVRFTGMVAGPVLTVTDVTFGTIATGATLAGTGVLAHTIIGAQISGTPGGVGTYAVAPAQAISTRILSAGHRVVVQATQITMQVDVHGPESSDNAQIISTLWRDAYAATVLRDSGFDLSPLHADEPRQMPFITGEDQYETRWVVEMVMQANAAVTLPQDYSDAVDIALVNVDAAFPPS